MVKRNMRQIMEAELCKIRNYPRWRVYRVVSLTEVNNELMLLRESGIKARKMPIQRDNVIVAYRIDIED